jgi:hypothetical protein
MRIGKAIFGLVTLAGMCALLLTGAPASAQESSAMKQVGMIRTGSGTFTLEVEGADIRTVMKAIADFSGRNIVVGKDVKATIRASLRNVGWQEAMRTVLRSNGLDYVDENGILRVDDASKLAAEGVERETARAKQMELVPLETRIVKLNYANAAELTAAIQSSMSRRGSVQVDKRTNQLIITDLRARWNRWRRWRSSSTRPRRRSRSPPSWWTWTPRRFVTWGSSGTSDPRSRSSSPASMIRPTRARRSCPEAAPSTTTTTRSWPVPSRTPESPTRRTS